MSSSNSNSDLAAEWESIRGRFKDSPMKDMELAKLGQNAGISWPFKGSGETPSKYIEHDFESLNSVPGLIGKKSRIRSLIGILQETLAFDDPFGEMADKVEMESIVDDVIERNLAKNKIDGSFPIELTHFADPSKAALKAVGVNTLSDAVTAGQHDGEIETAEEDLKIFLNAIANKDEHTIKRFLPYRKGGQGLHLAEAISMIAEHIEPATKLSLMEKSGFELDADEQAQVSALDPSEEAAAMEKALTSTQKACEWFTEEAAQLEEILTRDETAERFFLILNDPERERLAIGLTERAFGIGEKKTGLFKRLFGKS